MYYAIRIDYLHRLIIPKLWLKLPSYRVDPKHILTFGGGLNLYCLPSTGQTFARLRDEWLVCRIFLLGKVTSKVTRSTNPHCNSILWCNPWKIERSGGFPHWKSIELQDLGSWSFLHRFASYPHWWQKISGYHCMKWHPDGMILAAGTQAIRKFLGRILLDLKSCVAAFRCCLWNDTLELEGEPFWWNDGQTGDKPPPMVLFRIIKWSSIGIRFSRLVWTSLPSWCIHFVNQKSIHPNLHDFGFAHCPRAMP